MIYVYAEGVAVAVGRGAFGSCAIFSGRVGFTGSTGLTGRAPSAVTAESRAALALEIAVFLVATAALLASAVVAIAIAALKSAIALSTAALNVVLIALRASIRACIESRNEFISALNFSIATLFGFGTASANDDVVLLTKKLAVRARITMLFFVNAFMVLPIWNRLITLAAMGQYSRITLWFSCENLTRSLSFIGFSINSCESYRMGELIMIVEDEAGVRELLRDTLKIAGFETIEADNGMSALTVLRSNKPDLIIIDINMPLMDGFELVERLRGTGDLVPVLMLTARGDQQDISRGLTIGADDYVVKPFGLEELILRVKAIIRRSKKSVDIARTLICGPISLDEEIHKVSFNNEEINLSPTEFRLLQMLIEKKGRVLSKKLLLDEVWGITFESESTVVDTYISYLRKKLHRDGFEGIKTVRGVGFQIMEPKETI